MARDDQARLAVRPADVRTATVVRNRGSRDCGTRPRRERRDLWRRGREFRIEEETFGGPRVVILSSALWQSEFGGDSTVLNRSISINGRPYLVIGILPPFFNFLGATDLFTPMQANPVPLMRAVRNLV